jgi:uncharacterized membrane protein YjfL (UPF0719 family)
MSTSLDPIVLNLLYATLGGLLGLLLSWLGGWVFQLRMGFKLREELKNDNRAVGMVLMGIFIGNGIGMGLIIGLSLN